MLIKHTISESRNHVKQTKQKEKSEDVSIDKNMKSGSTDIMHR